jgi:hypothetical protein
MQGVCGHVPVLVETWRKAVRTDFADARALRPRLATQCCQARLTAVLAHLARDCTRCLIRIAIGVAGLRLLPVPAMSMQESGMVPSYCAPGPKRADVVLALNRR